jgi:hypothetical protein
VWLSRLGRSLLQRNPPQALQVVLPRHVFRFAVSPLAPPTQMVPQPPQRETVHLALHRLGAVGLVLQRPLERRQKALDPAFGLFHRFEAQAVDAGSALVGTHPLLQRRG